MNHPPRSTFGEPMGSCNYVRFRLDRDLIAIGLRTKKPGEKMVGEPIELIPASGENVGMVPYERLLGDAAHGDPLLFASEDSVEANWRIVDGVIGGATPVYPYEPGSWGPKEAERLAPEDGWHVPMPARQVTPTAPAVSKP